MSGLSVRPVLHVLVLAAVYLLVLASLDPWDALAGLLLGTIVLAGFRRFLRQEASGRGERPLRRLWAVVPFALVVLRDIVVGTWDVASVVLHLRPLRSPGIVAIPIGRRSERGLVVTAFVATLSPGEFLVDVDRARGVMLMHVLDASDPDGVRARFEHFYERWQSPVFP